MSWPASGTRTSSARWPSSDGPSSSPGRCAARPVSGSASRSRGSGWPSRRPTATSLEPLLELVADEVNVKSIELIGDESDLVDRKVKPLLPMIGKKLGPAIPAVMAAAREGRVEIHPDGSVTLGGRDPGCRRGRDPGDARDQARPSRSDDGLVVVIDTELTPELRAEGDARELQRAIQDLRRDAELALDGHIELWIDACRQRRSSRTWRPSPQRPWPSRPSARRRPTSSTARSSSSRGRPSIGLRAIDGGSS